jgi:hypothetical protein
MKQQTTVFHSLTLRSIGICATDFATDFFGMIRHATVAFGRQFHR